MVTAETAAALPVLALLLGFGLWAVVAVGAQVRCTDAAREGARMAARGETPASSEAAARRAAPPGASIVLTEAGGQVRVVVSAQVGPLGGWLPRLATSGSAVALLEPDSGAPPSWAGAPAVLP